MSELTPAAEDAYQEELREFRAYLDNEPRFSANDVKRILQSERRKTMNEPQLHTGTDRVGFVATHAQELAGHHDRLDRINERLNNLGARLLGSDQLPRNLREKNIERAPPSDAPEPVRSDTEQVIHQTKRLQLMVDDLEEIVGFVEQL